MKQTQPLSLLPNGTPCIIQEVGNAVDLRRRLIELGFAPGNTVIPVFSDKTAHIRAYAVSNSVIALRSRDAKDILVTPKEGATA